MLVRLRYRPPSDDPGPLSLGHYQVACLAGGPNRVAASAITGLFAAGLLHLEGQLLVGRGELPPWADPVERAVFARASRPELARSPRRRRLRLAGAFTSDLERAVRADVRRLRQELTDLGLVLADSSVRTTRLVTAPIMLIPLLLGSGELFRSLAAGQPEGYFVVAIFMSLVIGAMVVLTDGGATRRGDRVLAKIRSHNAALATAPNTSLEPDQLALAVALWGPRVLAASPLAQLGRTLEQAHSSDSMD